MIKGIKKKTAAGFKIPSQRFVLFIFIALIAGCTAGFFAGKSWKNFISSRKNLEIHRHDEPYPFINPLIFCENYEEDFGEITNFKGKIQAAIEDETRAGKVKSVAYYFRDLNDGPWIGVYEKEDFAPASLLKIPVMLGYLKEAEDNPAILKKKLVYDFDINSVISQDIKPEEELKKGNAYTVEELIRRMIIYSDNAAFALLIRNDIEGRMVSKAYRSIGLSISFKEDSALNLNIKQFVSFIRVLYNSSFLGHKYSNYALSLLSKSEFKEGLKSGVPGNVIIAHKFGEMRAEDGSSQLHDCGIIYYPQNPYLLCVMTRGKDLSVQAKTISRLSSLTYHEVDTFIKNSRQ